MFVVFGSEKKFEKIESLITTYCSKCKADSNWSIWLETEWASLFFITLFPICKKYHLGCDKCGYGLPLDKPLAIKMLNPSSRTDALHDQVVLAVKKSQQDYQRQHS